MKKFIKSAAVSCTALLMAFTAMSGASAVSGSRYEFSIKDVTNIQKYCANISDLNAAQKNLCDVNADGKIDITDATAIQKDAAEISSLGEVYNLSLGVGESYETLLDDSDMAYFNQNVNLSSIGDAVKLTTTNLNNGKVKLTIKAVTEGTAKIIYTNAQENTTYVMNYSVQ